MISPLTPIQPIQIPDAAPSVSGAASSGGFGSMFESYVGNVQSSQDAAQHSVDSFLAGNNTEVHSVALSVQRASLEFQMFMQVRNKVVDAYQEVMKMQL